MALRVAEDWQDFEELAPSPGLAVASARVARMPTSGNISELVDQLLLSLETILAPGDSERRAMPQRASNSPAQRMSLLAQRIEGLPPPARAVMQRVFGEVSAQLLEIRRLGGALHAAVRESDEARRAAEQHAMTDPLTGLLNRRGFAEYAARALAQAGGARESVLLLFVDIDQMKQINDRGGHGAGDRAIQVAAEALRRSFRAQDLLVRWGGDEFAVISVGNPLGMQAVTERIRRQATLVCAEHAVLPAVTLSVGAAQRENDESFSLDELMGHADHAMYLCKRDRVASAVSG